MSEASTGVLNWSASSDLGASIAQSGRQLTSTNQQQTATLDSIPCQNGTFTFSGQGGNTVQVPWSCTPPTLKVTLSGNCPNNVCTEWVEEAGGPGTVNWTVAADSDLPEATFQPSSGSVSTGEAKKQVRVIVPSSGCPAGGHWDYTWPTGRYRVTFTCHSATPTPTPHANSSLFLLPFAVLISRAGLAMVGRRVWRLRAD